jgi:hypothetical protein
MAVTLGQSLIDVGIQDNTKKGMSKIEKNSIKSADKVEQRFKKVGTAIAAAFGGAVVINAIKNMSSAALAFASDMNTTAKSIGITVEELSALSHAASIVGVNSNVVSDSMIKIAKQMDSARNGSKLLGTAFNGLNIDINSDSVIEATNKILSALNSTKDMNEQQKLLGSLAQIVGNKAAIAYAKMALQVDSVTDAMNQATEAGTLMSTETGEKLNLLADQIQAMKNTALIQFSEGFAEAFSTIDTKELSTKIGDLAYTIGKFVANVGDFFKN